MQFKDNASIIFIEQIADGYGGFTNLERVVCEIKVTVAPYSVEVGKICTIPNPNASVKFFTNSVLPFDEDSLFYIDYKGKRYKKVSIIDYGKCSMIIGERI